MAAIRPPMIHPPREPVPQEPWSHETLRMPIFQQTMKAPREKAAPAPKTPARRVM